MPKFKIEWDCGYGLETEIIEADSHSEAEQEAYQRWVDDAEMQAHYYAEPVEDIDEQDSEKEQ